jgi:hypothetical protein
MAVRWQALLHADLIPWLLEPENPAIRYWTLIDLLNTPGDAPDVQSAQARIASYRPVAEVLATQKRDGYWVKRDYYLPKHHGTFWTLSVLADVGLTAENEQIRRACEFMFTFQREHGPFCRRRRVAGEGIVWDTAPGPCTHARIVRFLIQFGYSQDPRIRAAILWLLEVQRDDGMWHCGRSDRPGCLRATHDVLRVAALDPASAAHPAVARGAAAICELLLEPRMARYHVGIPWTVLAYPYFDYSLISTLDALARLGYGPAHSRIAPAIEYLLSQQATDGAWYLDQVPRRPPFDVGQPGEPNKWLTLDALRALKLLYE